MKPAGDRKKNDELARKLRARAAALEDPQLKAKVTRIARMVQNAGGVAPESLLKLVARKPTRAERRRGIELETLARRVLSGHGRVIA